MRARRGAIIGTKGFQRSDESVEIECFPWKEVASVANPSDYDTIIFNLLSLKDPTTVDWDGFFDKFTVLTTLEVLVNGGNIVIIGDPRFWLNEPIVVPGGEEGTGTQFLEWTGIQFDWDEKSGKTKIPVKRDPSTEPYLNYIEKISHWDYSLRKCVWPMGQQAMLESVLQKTVTQFSSSFQVERICENRYRGLIVFAIKLSIADRTDIGGGYLHKNGREGRIIFLPQVEVPQEDLVAMVLTDILGIQVIVPEPSWATAILAPGQPHIEARIEQIKHDIATLEVNLKSAMEERQRVRRCVHLLYKLGDELEDAVREILCSLGSTIEPPIERGKEDGWLTIEIEGKVFEGVLEIKGTRKNQFSLEGLRQLMEWKKRGILNRQKKYKGIFVGNSGAEKEVSEREVPFADPWTATAKLDDIAVLNTCDLYKLYRLDCEGNLDRNQFWRALFQTNGVFSLDDFSQPMT